MEGGAKRGATGFGLGIVTYIDVRQRQPTATYLMVGTETHSRRTTPALSQGSAAFPLWWRPAVSLSAFAEELNSCNMQVLIVLTHALLVCCLSCCSWIVRSL